MNQIQNLIGAASIVSDIYRGTYTETQPTGLLDPAEVQAPEVVVNLYNQCRKDQALLENSNALVTLHEIGAGQSEATRKYWKHAEAFGQTLKSLEKLLTPLPSNPIQIKMIVGNLTLILKSSDTCSKGITESLIELKAEIDQLSGQ